MNTKKAFCVVVSGGPAPGINSVISTCVIEAINSGYTIKGAREGFRGLVEQGAKSLINLTIDQVTPLAASGGSLLGICRFNPFKNERTAESLVNTLRQENIDKLIVIGGEGSAFLSHQIATKYPEFKIVHVPKTIDNDLILPNQYPSFGFETARSVGTEIISTLMVDARTTRRWFLVTSMGRKSGFLALGLGLASGATLTVIPEEFTGKRPHAQGVADIIFHSMQRRAKEGKFYGVALTAEGILDQLDPASSPLLKDCPRDELGRLRYSDLDLGDVLAPLLRARCHEAGLDLRIITKNIGYELRCHTPISFDLEYTKFLGYGAVRLLLEGRTGVMVNRNYDRLGHQPLQDLISSDGSVISRSVDLNSDYYKVARSFMIREARCPQS